MNGTDDASSPPDKPPTIELKPVDSEKRLPDNPAFSPSRTLTDYILDFLSNASDEALLCVFTSLIVATIVFFGRVGLLLIGLVAGIILHASWDNTQKHSQNERSLVTQGTRRRELGIEIASRLLNWRPLKIPDDVTESNSISLEGGQGGVGMGADFSAFRPATANALTVLTDAIMKDYVDYWYSPILPSEISFPLSCRRLLTKFITALSSHLTRKRPADIFLHFVTYSSSIIIVFLSELSVALNTAESNVLKPEEAIRRYLERSPQSSLANVLDADQQRKKLKMVADDVLSNFLDSKAYDCDTARVFLREIFAGIILDAIIGSCSRPKFINEWIIYLLQEGEPEIMNAIDAGVEGAQSGQAIADTSLSAKEGPSTQNLIGTLHNEPQFFQSQDGTLPRQLDRDTNAALEGTKGLSDSVSPNDMLGERIVRKTGDSTGEYSSDTTAGQTVTQKSPQRGKTGEFEGNGAEGYLFDNQGRNSLGSAHQRINTAKFDQSPASPAVIPSPADVPTSILESGPAVTLCGASIFIDDVSELGDRGIIRSRPSTDYSVQIEPSSSRYPGWMIFRKYSDFEQLHEALGPISRLNKIRTFTDKYPALPTWRGKTRQEFAQRLQVYLRDALQHEPLAESERTRRFFDKDRELEPTSTNATKLGFSFPRQRAFENMGRGVLEVLTSTPKGVAEGSKTVTGGVLGNVGVNKRAPDSAAGRSRASQSIDPTSATSSKHRHHQMPGISNPIQAASASLNDLNLDGSANESVPCREHVHYNQPHLAPVLLSSDSTETPHKAASETGMNPAMADAGKLETSTPCDQVPVDKPEEHPPFHTSSISDTGIGSETPHPNPERDPTLCNERKSVDLEPTTQPSDNIPISEEETQVAVELIFAVINELYTLSSAWNIRRTFLNAAKSYILRPGNPSLEGIRVSIQDSMIDANTSDEAIATLIAKVRENSLPAEDEMRAYPPPLSDAEKDQLRIDARNLLLQRGMPRALMSVMGTTATREALGKIFDCLQVEVIARGFIFALLLQGLRAVIL